MAYLEIGKAIVMWGGKEPRETITGIESEQTWIPSHRVPGLELE